MRRIALIDFDSLYYLSNSEYIQDSIVYLGERINLIIEEVKPTEYCGFYSISPYFRHNINQEYKGNRPIVINWVKTLKEYAKIEYKAVSKKWLEADDLIAYWNYHYYDNPDIEIIICSMDKDLLNLRGKSFDFKKWKWNETTIEDETRFFNRSLIIGDTADNIKGLSGKGAVFCNKLEKLGTLTEERVLKAYTDQHGVLTGTTLFLENYRLLKLLSTEEDFEREGVIPPLDLETVLVNTETIEF